MSKPREREALTPEHHQALGEYVIRQQRKGRTEIPREEIIVAIEAIKAALDTVEY